MATKTYNDITFSKDMSNTRASKAPIGAYHMIGDDDFEPQRSNNFELHIYGLEGLEYNMPQYATGGESGAPTSAGSNSSSSVERTLTLSTVSVGQINTEVGILEVPYGNTKVKFAGLPNVSNTDIVFNDYLGKETERILAAWHALVFNPETEAIGRASVYKKPALLIETAPDGSRARAWHLKGCWPSNMQYGNYDYNTGETRKITASIAYDIAVPLK